MLCLFLQASGFSTSARIPHVLCLQDRWFTNKGRAGQEELEERHDVRPDFVVQNVIRQAGVELDRLGAVALAAANVDVAVSDAVEEGHADGEAGGGEHEAADPALVAVDAVG